MGIVFGIKIHKKKLTMGINFETMPLMLMLMFMF